MNVAPSETLRRAEHLVTRHILGETIVVPISGDLASLDDIFSLNETGGFVWDRLDGGTTLAEIIASLSEAFDVEPVAAEADVTALAGELLEAALAERVEP